MGCSPFPPDGVGLCVPAIGACPPTSRLPPGRGNGTRPVPSPDSPHILAPGSDHRDFPRTSHRDDRCPPGVSRTTLRAWTEPDGRRLFYQTRRPLKQRRLRRVVWVTVADRAVASRLRDRTANGERSPGRAAMGAFPNRCRASSLPTSNSDTSSVRGRTSDAPGGASPPDRCSEGRFRRSVMARSLRTNPGQRARLQRIRCQSSQTVHDRSSSRYWLFSRSSADR